MLESREAEKGANNLSSPLFFSIYKLAGTHKNQSWMFDYFWFTQKYLLYFFEGCLFI